MSVPVVSHRRRDGLVHWLTTLRGRAVLAAVLVSLAALALYVTTLMPDVGFWDTAEFQAVGPVLGIAHPTGYPSYTMLAWLASVVLQPFGNEALRANLLSALLGAGGAGLVAMTATLLTGRLVLGVAAGAGLALTTEAWAVSLHADPHALHLFLAALILLLLTVWSKRVHAGRSADRWLVAAAIVYGVSLGNHALTFLLAPAIALFVLLVDPGLLRRPRLILACAGALVLTTIAVYLYLPIRSSMNPPLDYANPETWAGFRYLVLAEQFRGEFRSMPEPLEALRRIAGESFFQLGILAALALLGAVSGLLRRPAIVVLLAGWFIINWFFALGYVNADIGRYYLVPLMSTAVFGAMGAAAVWNGFDRLRPPGRVAELATATVIVLVLLVPPLIVLPARHDRMDQSNQILARIWLTDIMRELPPESVVISWWSYSTTLWYGKYVDGLRPDVTVIDDSNIVNDNLGDVHTVIESFLGRRPVFLIRLPFDMSDFRARYELEPLRGIRAGDVYLVKAARESARGALL